MSFQKGLGQLTEELARRLAPEKIKLSCRVTAVGRNEEGAYSVKLASGEILEAQAVILAIPAYEASRVIGKLDPPAGEKLARIPAASSATISLAYHKNALPGPLEGFGLLVPQVENRKIKAITFTSRKWRYRSSAGKEELLLRVFVGGARNQQLVTLDDEELLRLVRDELQSILGITAQPIFYRSIVGSAVPQYIMAPERMEAIRRRVSFILDYLDGAYDGVGIPNCIEAEGAEGPAYFNKACRALIVNQKF